MEKNYKFSTGNFVQFVIRIAASYRAVLKDAAPDACVGVGTREKVR
jgi:hypothetical protein